MPGHKSFGTFDVNGNPEETVMTVDEYECIRLIDVEGLNQEECSLRMGIARTTAQSIYNSARLKLGRFLVDGGKLIIEGGEYMICKENRAECGRRCCKSSDTASDPKK